MSKNYLRAWADDMLDDNDLSPFERLQHNTKNESDSDKERTLNRKRARKSKEFDPED